MNILRLALYFMNKNGLDFDNIQQKTDLNFNIQIVENSVESV